MSGEGLQWMGWVKRIQALAQSGLAYCKDDYDRERYEELRDLSVRMMSAYTDTDPEKVRELFAGEKGYQTPKVDVRAAIFDDRGRLLLVRERADGRWAMPGGWADIGCSPGEVAAKEVREEAGLTVEPERLLAVLDKKFHNHPPEPWYCYKIFIRCRIVEGTPEAPEVGMETTGAGFFAEDALPELSLNRNTEGQIRLMFDYCRNPNKEPAFD